MKNNILVLTIFSTIHFIVDFSCIFFMYNLFIDKTLEQNIVVSMIIIYNFFAFFMQAPLGIIADKFMDSYKYGIIGCILIIMSVFFSSYKFLSSAILGIGNALFHLSGGIEILNRSEGKSSMAGVFVSTGAIGLFLGGQIKNIFNINSNFKYFIIFILLLSIILLFITNRFIGDYRHIESIKNNNIRNGLRKRSPLHLRFIRRCAVGAKVHRARKQPCKMFSATHLWDGLRKRSPLRDCCSPLRVYRHIESKNNSLKANYKTITLLLIISLVFCIIIRSFVGTFSNFSFKKIFTYNLLLTIAISLGKFTGGFLSDTFSAKKTTFISLFLSAVLYVFSEKYYFAGILSMFLFNMTMPITLTYLSNIMDDSKGLAFGLTTLALFLGYIPIYNSFFTDINIFKFIPYIIIIQNILLCIIITIENKILNNKN